MTVIELVARERLRLGRVLALWGGAVAIAAIASIMAVAALLKGNPNPSDGDIDSVITNICRCGTYQQVRDAIHMAAKA